MKQAAVFDGETYEPSKDCARLTTQMDRVSALMSDLTWRALAEIVDGVSYPPYERASEAGVSARLRDLRKSRFGGFKIARRRREGKGLFEYRMCK